MQVTSKSVKSSFVKSKEQPVIYKTQISKQLKIENVKKDDFWFTWQFVGLYSDKHIAKNTKKNSKKNGWYCYGCVLETCLLIRHLKGIK